MKKEFNKAMLSLFAMTGRSGMKIVHDMGASKVTVTLYEVFLSGNPIILTDVIEQRILAESSTYRAAKRLRQLGLIKVLKKEHPRIKGQSGPRRNIWILT